MNDVPRFVLDTHALWWYMFSPRKLPAAARAAFRLAESGISTLIVPAIVVAEIYFLSAKLGDPYPPALLLEDLGSTQGIEFSELGRRQLELLAQLDDIPEMHDRLIAAEAITQDAPVVTRDAALSATPAIETVW